MDEELQLRIKFFFDFWKQRCAFISTLNPIERRYEGNLLLWGFFDALSGWWATSIGKKECSNSSKRIIFNAFLARYGGEVFQLVSLPDVWSRVDRGDARTKLPENVSTFLSIIGERRTPEFIEQYQTRSSSQDLSLSAIMSKTLADCPETNRTELEQWLTLSQYGAIAYKEMRNAYIHEGRPGKKTHDFKLHGWDKKPTYRSSVYCAPPIMGFSIEFMLGVSQKCIKGFEAEALALQVDPAPDE